MEESKIFLTLLSKVLHGGERSTDNEFDKLYATINNDLFTIINQSHFLAAAEIVTDFHYLFDGMEDALSFPEMFGQRLFSIMGKYINTTLKAIDFLFEDDLSELSEIRSIIPYFVCNSEETYIEAINFENNFVRLSFAEMKTLIKKSYKYKITLSRIVKFFKVHTPVKAEKACFIIGYTGHEKNFSFRRFCSGKISLTKKAQNRNTTLYIDEDSPNFEDKILEYICSAPRKTCGIYSEYHRLCSEVSLYLNNELRKSREIRTALTNDITMLEKNTKIFSDMQRKQDETIKSLRKISDAFGRTVSDINPVMRSLCERMGDNVKENDIVGELTFDSILKEMFNCVACHNFEAANKCLEMLAALDYFNIKLASLYLSCVKSGKCYEVEPDSIQTWADAKMAVAISDLDKLSFEDAERFYGLMKNNIETGKEFYTQASAKINEGMDTYIKLLKCSFEKGYELAGRKLLQLSEECKKIQVYPLACCLLPEACVKIAEKDIDKANDNRRMSIYSKEIVYYKLAASRGYLPAIGKIVDLIYNDRFVPPFQIRDDSERFAPMHSNGRTVMGLCQYLKAHSYNTMHYQEIYGVIAFCLNENPAEAMQALSGINTPASNYCKGVMYEFGSGTPRNLQQAISHYKKALDIQKTKNNLERAQHKLEKEQRNAYDKDTYSENSSYHSSVTTSSYSDSFCVITTATCIALQGKDDCEELNILRNFRDQHINNTEEGRELVLEYYRVAPLII